jgi:hypothetical protein
MFPQWLRHRATIPELEADQLIEGVPFGFCNAEWEALKQKMCPGDELWTFSSPPEDWERRMGFEGIALLRDGEIVDFFITALN